MRKMSEELTCWGITPNLLGHKYIIDALEIIKENPEAKFKLHKKIYPCIAVKNGVTPVSVERGIRTAIDRLWKPQYQTNLPEPIQLLIELNLLCVSAFLAALAQYIKEVEQND